LIVILELGGFKRLKIKNNFFLIVILELGGFKVLKIKKRKNRNNDLFLLKLKK
jgi:hypothetical protein